MKKILSVALASAAFANTAAPVASSAPAKAKGGAPKAEDRVAPIFTEIATDIKPPVSKSNRGNKSELAKKLLELPLNGSIGIQNKTKKQISSTVSKINNAPENQQQKKDENGNVVTTQGTPIKDVNGAVVGHGAPVAVMERVKEFEIFEVDPKTDPHKAMVRIFRVK